MRSRVHVAMLLALALLVCAPAAAQAAITITHFTATVEKPQGTYDLMAGDHPDVGITDFTVSGDTAKDVRVDLPAGLISNPQATPQCADSDFPTMCDLDTQIGAVDVTATLLGIATTFHEPVFNMVPKPGQVSDFAFNVPAASPSRTDIVGGVRDVPMTDLAGNAEPGDFGLFFTISGLPTGTPLQTSKLTFWGVPASSSHDSQRGTCSSSSLILSCGSYSTTYTPVSAKPFLSNPTLCDGTIAVTTLTVDSYSSTSATSSYPSPDTGHNCQNVPFAPTVTVTPDTRQRDTPTGVTIDVHVPQSYDDPSGIATSHVKDTVVTLPPGFTINPAAANGLQACTDAQFGIGTHDAIQCPDASKVGTAAIYTPVLSPSTPGSGDPPLAGAVYLGKPQPGNPYRLFVDVEGAGLAVRLQGKVTPDPATGQLTTTFANTPQVPFSDFVLHLNGGPNATLANPLACGAATTTAKLTPYSSLTSTNASGTAKATPPASFTVDADGKGGACPSPTPFDLGFQAGTQSLLAGAFSPFSLTVTRADGQQYLAGLQVQQPPGLLGQIAGITQCDDAGASSGNCPVDSRVGTATVAAGAGPAPFTLSGPVYLTGPYKGAPFGLVIVERAIAGPFDLGTVIVRTGIRVDPHDSHLTIDSDPLPTVLQGIPLRLRKVTVLIDADQFIFNPTNCAPTGVGATLTSTAGATQTLTSPFQATGCDALPFAPKLAASTTSRVSRKNGASLTVTLTQPQGQANTKSVSVTLPKQLSARLETVQLACPPATFEANPDSCPAGSKVGTVAARTPILDDPLSGPVLIVAHNGALPTLEALLRGSGITVDLSGTIGLGATLTSTFAAVPDVPITSFRLSLPTGPHSALASSADMCASPISIPATIVGQNGKKVVQQTPVSVPDCRLRILLAKVNRQSVTMKIEVPNPGRLTVSGVGLRTIRRKVGRAPGIVKMKLLLSKPAIAQLAAARAAHHKLTLRATVRLVPSGPGSRTKRTAKLVFR
jgi:hypothetical protein